ncbi:protein-glutamate O-methyltransferase [uncultured Tateyamaria sp.]|uniref:CheR family methyltransferase n=1 Tax=uncultured Tateyamaria sp. TaxID=455651 RepID=UPI00260C07C2|nr:protein-glutamate O-methyltransferase [uncultured Tateyamaria sp.]
MGLSGTELTLEKAAFDAIAGLAHREFGLHITSEKLKMVQSRLRHRLNALNLRNFDAYSDLVCSDQGAEERRYMISALTTNVSHFFREPHHFDLLSEAIRPGLQQRIAAGDRIRVWSAGCSNGQEPYSIAMHLLREEPSIAQADFKILATDIDPKVVSFAQNGVYAESLVNGVSAQDKAKFMRSEGDEVRVADEVSRHISFRELNLLSDWPMRHQFDVIFCRNVVIYFDQETQERLWPRFHKMLRPGGLLCLGHSERISAPAQFGFKTIGTTAYKKDDASKSSTSLLSGGQNGTS